MIVGDMDAVSDAALASGAEVVVHAYPDGRAPGARRGSQDLGIDAVTFPTTGTSEDIAMLLADEKGAELIVAVGTHATLIEFLDKGRVGMASTFLTRLRVGGKLVDAEGVHPALPQPDLRRRAAAARHRGARRDRRRAGRRPRPAATTSTDSATDPTLVPLGTGPVLVISFRYHLVSLVAVFLALALGIVVGTTALNGPITTDLRHQVDGLKKDRTNLAAQVKSLQGRSTTPSKFADTLRHASSSTGSLTDAARAHRGLAAARGLDARTPSPS